MNELEKESMDCDWCFTHISDTSKQDLVQGDEIASDGPLSVYVNKASWCESICVEFIQVPLLELRRTDWEFLLKVHSSVF